MAHNGILLAKPHLNDGGGANFSASTNKNLNESGISGFGVEVRKKICIWFQIPQKDFFLFDWH